MPNSGLSEKASRGNAKSLAVSLAEQRGEIAKLRERDRQVARKAVAISLGVVRHFRAGTYGKIQSEFANLYVSEADFCSWHSTIRDVRKS